MKRIAAGTTDSHTTFGGEMPDAGGVSGGKAPAFRLIAPAPSSIPVLIAVPHAGRAYSPALLGALRNPSLAAARLEDRLADALGEAVAAQTGAALLIADAPRAMIDLNRAPEDIDWGMIQGGAGPARAGQTGTGQTGTGQTVGGRARSGLGLVPRRLPGEGELWKRPLARAELEARIAGIHQPYHRCLADTMARLQARWGAALLVDLHSMPPLPSRDGAGGAQIVLGDRFWASCHGALVACAFTRLAREGWRAAHNRPYAGGYGLERHAATAQGIHALQIEVDRSCYLDAVLSEPGEGFAAVVSLLVDMVRVLAGEVAALGATASSDAGWAQAAE